MSPVRYGIFLYTCPLGLNDDIELIFSALGIATYMLPPVIIILSTTSYDAQEYYDVVTRVYEA